MKPRLIVTLILGAGACALATCYVNPPGAGCGCTSQGAVCTNGCIQVYCSVENSSSCDSRDGECGKTECSGSYVTVSRSSYAYTPMGIPCYCGGSGRLITSYTVGSCYVATLAGDKCPPYCN